MQAIPFDGGDPWEPLFLTPYVEAGKLEEGRHLARVTLPDVPDIESYSGFFTVNETYNSNLFFWYFSPTNNPATAEVIVHLQGFPGVSSVYGQFEENGPIEILKVQNGTKLNQRIKHLNQNNHLIYIDHSVGAGFSFTNDSRGYCTDQVQIGEQLYTAVVQIFQLFLLLQKTFFHITSELYAGKFATALARTIHQKNPTARININLQSLILGSCWCDPIKQMQYHRYTYQLGLHDELMADKVLTFEDKTIDLIKQEKWLEAAHYFETTFKIIKDWTYSMSYYNVAKETNDEEVPKFVALVQTSEIRKALHVGDLLFQDGENVREALRQDYMKSVAPWIAELVQNYFVKFYNGPLGAMVTYRGMINFIEIMDPSYRDTEIEILFYIPTDVIYTLGIFTGAPNSNITCFLLMTVGNLAAQDNTDWFITLIEYLIYSMITDKNGDFETKKPHITMKKVEDIMPFGHGVV